MWLGFPLSFWQSIFFWATSTAAIAGATSVASAFISAVVGYQISDIVQSDADQRIAEAAARGNEAQVEAECHAHERAAILEKEAADAKLEQEKLKAQLAWRELLPETLDNLQRHLSVRTGSVIIKHVANDPEALSLSIQLANIFIAAQWQLIGTASVTYADTLVTGLFIPNENGPDENFVREAFTAAGISFSTKNPICECVIFQRV